MLRRILRCDGALRLLVPCVLTVALLGSLGATSARAGERIFVQLLASKPTSLDPAKSRSIQDDQVMWLIYDALTQLSADATRMLPALAERWERSADGMTYTFTLRQNVRFHDGSPLDAEAVKVSYERQFLKGSPFYAQSPPNVYEKDLAALVKEIRILDPRTISIRIAQPRPEQFALVKIVSAAALRKHTGDLSRTPVGTGPFRLDRFEGGEVRLAPFADSWHGPPRLEAVRFVTAETKEVMERVAAGGIDLLYGVSPDYFESFIANPGVGLVKVGGLNAVFVGMQMGRPLLKDRRVREAVVRAVDRERLAAVLGRGAMVAAKGPLPPSCAGFDPAVVQPSYDPERARTLLKEAGADSGLSLTFLYFDPSELWTEVARTVQDYLRKVGITVREAKAADWNDFHAQRKKGDHDLYLYKFSVSTPDPDRFLSPLFHSEGPYNFGRFANARVDALLKEARGTVDGARRLGLYWDAARVIAEELPGLYLVHQINMAAVSSRVKGLTLNLYGLPQDKLARVEVEAR